MNKLDWSKEQRQAPIGLIIFSIETIRKLIKILWPVLIPIIAEQGNSKQISVLKEQTYFYGTIAVVVFVMINSLLSYWFFRFQIINGELLINKGYLKKIRLSIPLDRIQTVNIKQNIFHKILNLVSVDIDTAGGKDVEVKLIAIKKTVAEALKDEIQKNAKSITNTPEKIITDEIKENTTEEILALSLSDIVKVGLSENHLRSLAAILGIGYWIYSQFQDYSGNQADEFVTNSTQIISSNHISFYFWIFIFLLMFMISVLFSFILSFIRFYELKLSKLSNSFKLSFGLINTKEISIPMSKIQVISWHQNPFRQLLRFETLKIKQAVSGERIKKKQAIEIPACRLSHQKSIKNAIFGDTEPSFSPVYKTHWMYFLRNFIFFTIIFILPTIFFWWQDQEYQISIIIYEVFWAVFFFISYKRRGFRISESQLEITKGHISKSIYQMQNFKIQAINYNQNIFIKKRHLANITIFTASGDNLRIPYIPEKLAKELYNFLLYKIESSEKPWM